MKANMTDMNVTISTITIIQNISNSTGVVRAQHTSVKASLVDLHTKLHAINSGPNANGNATPAHSSNDQYRKLLECLPINDFASLEAWVMSAQVNKETSNRVVSMQLFVFCN